MRFLPVCRPSFLSLTSGILLLLGVGTSSCQSTKVAYQFRPAAASSTAARVPKPKAQPAPAVFAQPVSTPAPVVATPSTPVRIPARRLARLQRQVASAVAVAPKAVVRLRQESATQKVQRHQARPHSTTEVGLGTTVLGVLGLVVLPISLIGLLIWGGPVWAILAGLSALAILVAYLDPFG
ncbi:hypothetical protein MTX78_22925 [Hymenobacter tibetensis]|uniref:Uncharacterized protein n=1 Tax=Hymenobacter tibetensis TaxID=497967 RepID=A0ABY4CY12_9BACT|nr:hypothetical protein [Hymenobacter tibetensis]UOG74956.1 hypothetical protein MTX78_22925 [Hymenobacter tibetensis]